MIFLFTFIKYSLFLETTAPESLHTDVNDEYTIEMSNLITVETSESEVTTKRDNSFNVPETEITKPYLNKDFSQFDQKRSSEDWRYPDAAKTVYYNTATTDELNTTSYYGDTGTNESGRLVQTWLVFQLNKTKWFISCSVFFFIKNNCDLILVLKQISTNLWNISVVIKHDERTISMFRGLKAFILFLLCFWQSSFTIIKNLL